MEKLFELFSKGKLQLKNHLVMAPMTRSRAIGNLPNDLMVTYYAQRSAAGLIVTEGTAPAPEGLGYPRIPGIYSQEQVSGWKKVTSAVHQKGSKIFVQLMHTGRIGHRDNLPEGVQVVGPSEIKAAGEIFTDNKGMQEHSTPVALTTDGIASVIDGYVRSAQNAMEAGFDGVELHGANGYLPEQFLNPNVNNRTDAYGGSIENRSRLTLEIAKRVADAIGPGKVGVRISPFSTLGDLLPYDTEEVHQTYAYLASELNKLAIAYIHISASPSIPEKTYEAIRSAFANTLIYCNGLTPETAEAKLLEGSADLVAFGRSFLANPDFVERIEKGAPLNAVNFGALYTPDAVGYIDYPTLSEH
ncbi:alkene reductase [Telluribacter humicola]|uniref:alkene reductase n=1 Tax=Telluribacter humicola TaxID=1720261 RepID=UPI001A96A0A6|nr:alkene reductase [Telluribacter humicola]